MATRWLTCTMLAASQVKFFLNVKTNIQMLLMFFFLTKKIKLCEGLPDVTWLTLLVQKQHIQLMKTKFD